MNSQTIVVILLALVTTALFNVVEKGFDYRTVVVTPATSIYEPTAVLLSEPMATSTPERQPDIIVVELSIYDMSINQLEDVVRERRLSWPDNYFVMSEDAQRAALLEILQ